MNTPSLQMKGKKFISESKISMTDTIDLIYEVFEKLKLAKEEGDTKKVLMLEEELVLLRRELVKISNRKGRVLSEN